MFQQQDPIGTSDSYDTTSGALCSLLSANFTAIDKREACLLAVWAAVEHWQTGVELTDGSGRREFPLLITAAQKDGDGLICNSRRPYSVHYNGISIISLPVRTMALPAISVVYYSPPEEPPEALST